MYVLSAAFMVIRDSPLETAILLDVKDELGANPKAVPKRRKRERKDFIMQYTLSIQNGF